MPIEHNVITDPDIHEPKGVAAASDGQIYIADGAGSGDWRFLPHSYFYYDNIGTGTTITAPTAYTKVGPTTVGDASPHEFTHSGTGRLTYTGTATIDVSIHSTITMKHSAGAGVDCYFQIFKNGAGVSGGQAVFTADSANYKVVTLSLHTSLSTNDYVEVFTKASSGNVIVHAYNLEAIGRA